MDKLHTGIDRESFNQFLSERGVTVLDASRIIGISRIALWRKIGGISDFYRHEIIRFCEAFSDAEIDPMSLFFDNKVS